jgi:hypothetical protein
MKRSEALDIIDGILIDHQLPVLQGISKEILGSLEKAGMLPPLGQEKEVLPPTYGNAVVDIYCTRRERKWDDEN